jgi:flagellar basal body-associated protein FliL
MAIITIIIIIIIIVVVAAAVVGAGTVQSVERFGYELEDQRITNHFHRQSRPYRSPSLQSGGY